MNSTGRPSIPKWTNCKCVSELAAFIDAVPPKFRSPLLRAALTPQPTALGDPYVVGMLRSRLGDCLLEAFDIMWHATRPCSTIDVLCFESHVTEFESCQDLAQVQLALCDLLTVLALGQSQGVITDESQCSFSI